MLGADAKLTKTTSKALFGSIKELSDVFYKLLHLKILDFDHVATVLSGVRALVGEEQGAEVAQAADRLFEKVSKISSQLQSLASTHKLQVSQYKFQPAVVSKYTSQMRVQRAKQLSDSVERVLSDKSFREDLFDLAYLLNMEQNNLAYKVGDLHLIKTWLSALKLNDEDAYLKIDLSNDAEATLIKVFGSLNGYFIRFGMMVTEVVKLLSKEGVAFSQKQAMLAKLAPLQLYVKALEQTYVMLLEAKAPEPTKTSFQLRETLGKQYTQEKKSIPRQRDFLNLPFQRVNIKGSFQVLQERPRDQNPLKTHQLAVQSARQSKIDLFQAVNERDEKKLQHILASKVDLYVQDERGYTPLHYAVRNRAKNIVASLITAGADLDICSYRGTSARAMIHFLKDDGMLELISLSSTKSLALPDQKLKETKALKSSKNRLMSDAERGWITRLVEATEKGQDRTLRRLIDQPNTLQGLLNCLKETEGDVAKIQHGDLDQTLLHIAAAKGKSDCVKTLMHHGVPIDLPDAHGDTGLHLAASNGHLNAVMILVEIGKADVNRANKFGMTPLTLSIEKSHSEVFNFLVNFKDTHTLKTDNMGLPPLFQAIHHDNGQFVDALHSAKDGVALRYQHEAPLFTAAKLGKMNSLKVLLERKEPVNEVCKKSMYKDLAPVHVAIYYGHLQAVIALCIAGADLHKKTQSGNTAMSIAGSRSEKTPHGRLIKSFIDVAAKSQSNSESKAIVSSIESNAGLRAVGGDGNTALHLAALNGQFEIVLLLVLSGFSLNERNSKRQTPLHVADRNARGAKCTRFFVAAGADLRAETKEGKSVLASAYESGRRDLANAVRSGLGLESIGWLSWTFNKDQTLAEAGVADRVPTGLRR